MIPRTAQKALFRLAKGFPIVAITGPRQSGKTTLAKLTFPLKPYLSLEDPDVRSTAESDPRGLLTGFPNGAILDGDSGEIGRLFRSKTATRSG